MRSGVYAVRLQCGDQHDNIPFFVRPARGGAQSSACVLLPTFTYTIYGNYARGNVDEAARHPLVEGQGPENAQRQVGLPRPDRAPKDKTTLDRRVHHGEVRGLLPGILLVHSRWRIGLKRGIQVALTDPSFVE